MNLAYKKRWKFSSARVPGCWLVPFLSVQSAWNSCSFPGVVHGAVAVAGHPKLGERDIHYLHWQLVRCFSTLSDCCQGWRISCTNLSGIGCNFRENGHKSVAPKQLTLSFSRISTPKSCQSRKVCLTTSISWTVNQNVNLEPFQFSLSRWVRRVSICCHPQFFFFCVKIFNQIQQFELASLQGLFFPPVSDWFFHRIHITNSNCNQRVKRHRCLRCLPLSEEERLKLHQLLVPWRKRTGPVTSRAVFDHSQTSSLWGFRNILETLVSSGFKTFEVCPTKSPSCWGKKLTSSPWFFWWFTWHGSNQHSAMAQWLLPQPSPRSTIPWNRCRSGRMPVLLQYLTVTNYSWSPRNQLLWAVIWHLAQKYDLVTCDSPKYFWATMVVSNHPLLQLKPQQRVQISKAF